MFLTQVRVKEFNAGAWIRVWRDIKPSGRNTQPYLYDTADAARRAIALSNDGSRTREDFRIIDLASNKEI